MRYNEATPAKYGQEMPEAFLACKHMCAVF